MNRKTVGIDVDDVLAQFMKAFINFHNENYLTSYVRDDFFSLRFWEVIGGNREEAQKKVFEFFESEHFKTIRPVEGSADAVRKLSKTHDLVVVTSRQTELEDRTLAWIDRHFPGIFREVRFGNHYGRSGEKRPKSDICRELGVEILVDDSLEYALECAEAGISAILLDNPWNKTDKTLPENVFRVKSWRGILSYLNAEAE